jgi:hypothetical protein
MSATSTGVWPRADAARESAPASRKWLSDRRDRRASASAWHYGRILTAYRRRQPARLHCIGPAVNLAARLEKIAGKLNRTVVGLGRIAGICAGGWDDLGEFPIADFQGGSTACWTRQCRISRRPVARMERSASGDSSRFGDMARPNVHPRLRLPIRDRSVPRYSSGSVVNSNGSLWRGRHRGAWPPLVWRASW